MLDEYITKSVQDFFKATFDVAFQSLKSEKLDNSVFPTSTLLVRAAQAHLVIHLDIQNYYFVFVWHNVIPVWLTSGQTALAVPLLSTYNHTEKHTIF